MNARAATLAALLVVAGSTLAVAGVNPALAQSTPGPSVPGSEPPEETEDGATFTVSTQSIDLHQSEGGTICAKKMAPDVNEVTITHATMNGVEMWLGNEEEPKKVTTPTAEVDEIVLYTNGENQLVNLLATTGACIPLDQPQQTVLEVYYQEAGTLQMDQFQFVTGGTSPPPEPGGLTVPSSLLNNSSSTDGPVSNTTDALNGTTDALNGTTDVVGNATDTVGRVTDAVNGTTPTGAVGRVSETAKNVTETVDGVENPTGTVNDTLETVNGTTGTVTDTVGDTIGAVDDTTDTVNETVDDPTGTVDETTKTVDSATDAVENTTTDVGDTVEDTTDTVTDPPENGSEATTEVRDTVKDTGDTAEDATTEVRDTVEDTTGNTQETVQDTTTEVRTTIDEVVPPTAGFGLPVDVPLVGEQVPLDASKSTDSDGSIQTYEWDVDGDGNYEKTGERVTHAFSSAGKKEVTLRVTDADGATDTVTKTVTVNAPPTAAFAVLSDLLTIGEPISLDGTRSSDPDGEIAKYEWDVDGDGKFEQTGATPSPTFDSLGSHEIGLRVTDDRGATDTVTKTIDLTQTDDGGLLSGSSSDGGSTTTDSGGTTTDGGSTTTSSDDGGIDIIGTLLP